MNPVDLKKECFTVAMDIICWMRREQKENLKLKEFEHIISGRMCAKRIIKRRDDLPDKIMTWVIEELEGQAIINRECYPGGSDIISLQPC
ncbi:MAG: hypothetical protein WC758_02605 [Candidatus Woesearchaeota archaeon]|jgi:hypothetical protein